MEILNPYFEGRSLAFFLECIGHLFLDLFHDVLDTSWMDASVRQQTLQRQPGDLTANGIKTRDNDRFWRVINDEIYACGRFEGTNIAPFTPNDTAFHFLARQRHHRD